MASTMRSLAFKRRLLVHRGTQFGVLQQSNRNQLLQARFNSAVALPDKFKGKRRTLDVILPDLEEPEADTKTDPAIVPFVPDHYGSEAVSNAIAAEKAEKAGELLPGETPLPKVVTAAAETGSAVSSNIFQKTEDLKEFVGVEAKQVESKLSGVNANLGNLTSLEGWKTTLGNVQSSAKDTFASFAASAQHGESDPKRTELDGHDVNGLYILGGIIGVGWLLGGLLAKKGTHPDKGSSSHH